MEEEKEKKIIKIIIAIVGFILLLLVVLLIGINKNFTITYYNDNIEIGKKLGEKNDKIEMPDYTYLKPGYRMIGWKTEDGTEYKINEEIELKENLKLYAIWEEINCEHLNQVNVGYKEANCTTEGYSGDIQCSDCKVILQKGEVIPSTGIHKYIASGTCRYCSKEAEYKITPANYGDKINYASQGCSDWKVFYNDGQNVYIISSSYVEIPEKWRSSNSRYTFNPFRTDWLSENIAISGEGYIFYGDIYQTIIDNLKDSNNWQMFFNNEYASYVYGTPTLEMFINSWNAKGYTKLYTSPEMLGGTYVSTTPGGNEGTIDLNSSDRLYFPEHRDNCYGYILAEKTQHLELYNITDSGELGETSVNFIDERVWYNGLRPVVRINSNIGFENVNGVWNLVK